MVDAQALCLSLMEADSEAEVISILRKARYWDNDAAWRYIGDDDSNWSTIGNQQSDAVPALCEKFVNAIDAMLMNRCLESGIDPKGPAAPRSVREAVARFFEDAPNPEADHTGKIANWVDPEIRKVARQITLSATGLRGGGSLSIADVGEGQAPDMVPETFMSLHKRNKVEIPFVQGKFNMGGTGALYFCGSMKMQLIITRRNPRLLGADADARDHDWSFTVTRREATGARNPVCTYLAPVDAEATPRRGKVLSFSAAAMPLLPESTKRERNAYSREVAHGSLVKLYDYDYSPRSNIVFTRKGLRSKIETHLPELALPLGIFECRPYTGTEGGSFFTPARGTATRLEQEKGEDYLEFPPIGDVVRLNGTDIFLRVYAFKRPKSRKEGFLAEYAHGAGVLYTVNGQTHSYAGKEFFRRDAVDLDYLKDDLLVTVDCSQVDEISRADLFMNSRDRNRVTPVWKELERAVERVLKRDERLQQLALRRREEAIRDRTEDNKALADLLGRVLTASPDLARILLGGSRLPAPFPKPGSRKDTRADTYRGRRFPSFFHFEKHGPDEEHKRKAEIGRELRVRFVTDAEDDYFVRAAERGVLDVAVTRGEAWLEPQATTLSLHNGVARWSAELPGSANIGDILTFDFEVSDSYAEEPFRNRMVVEVVPQTERAGGGERGTRKRRANTDEGDTDADGGLALPEVIPVSRKDYDEFDFDDFSALLVRRTSNNDGATKFDFYYNVDNESLVRAQKGNPRDKDLIREQFRCALVLVGLALIKEAQHPNAKTPQEVDVEQMVLTATRALAPVLLPLVEYVGTLSVTPV